MPEKLLVDREFLGEPVCSRLRQIRKIRILATHGNRARVQTQLGAILHRSIARSSIRIIPSNESIGRRFSVSHMNRPGDFFGFCKVHLANKVAVLIESEEPETRRLSLDFSYRIPIAAGRGRRVERPFRSDEITIRTIAHTSDTNWRIDFDG